MERLQRWRVRKTSPNTWSVSSAICWRRGVLVCVCPQESKTIQQRWLRRTLWSEQDKSRRVRETHPGIRMAVWVSVNQPSKRWRDRHVQPYFKCYADDKCNIDKFPSELQFFSWLVRHAAWTLTRYALKADGQTSFFKLMSKDYHGEISKFSELVWFRIPAKQPKLAEQWRETHWVGKSERSDEHLLAIRGSTYFSESDLENTTCAQSWMRRPQDRSTSRIHVGPARSNTALTQDAQRVHDHTRPFVERGSRPFGPRSLQKQKFQSVLKRKLQIVLLTLYQLIQTRESANQWSPQPQPEFSLLRWR